MWLAQRGVVSLLPDEPGSAPYWFDVVRKRESDARDATLTVAGLRRALDVLVATNAVDPKDLGLVGHDFGAMYGALMLAFDRRPTGAVFMTPTPTFREWFDLDTKRPPPDAAAYERQLAAFDLPSYPAHTTLRATLVQFSARDVYVSAANAKAFATALSPRGRTVRTWLAAHLR